jgi:hypothetical protein
MINFCCEDMERNALKDANDPYAGKNVAYEVQNRCFFIYDAGSNRYGTCINYCPFCGAKLPTNLIDERWSTILDELGPDYLPDDEGNPPKKELPEEFQTDEWWKKRGL